MILLGKNVLLAEAPGEKTTASGIILTGATSKASKPALILEVGDDVNSLIKPNKKAHVDWHGAIPVDYKGIPAVIVEESKIKAVFD